MGLELDASGADSPAAHYAGGAARARASRVAGSGERLRCRLVLLGAGALAAAQTACSAGAAGGAGGAAAPAGAGRELAPARLEAWYGFRNAATDQVMQQKIVPAFAARQPRVEVNAIGGGGGLDKLLTTAAAGTPPNLLTLGAAQVVTVVGKDLALGLDARLKGGLPLDDFFPAAVEQARWKGQQWGLTFSAEPNTYFWRRDLLEQHGVRAVPATYEDALEAAQKLTQLEGDRVLRAGATTVQLWGEFLAAMRGLKAPMARQGKAVFNGAEGLLIAQFQVDRAAVSAPPGTTPPPDKNPLGSGAWGGAWGGFLTLANDAKVGTPESYRQIALGEPLVAGNQRYRVPAGRSAQPAAFTYHMWWAIIKPAGALDQAWAFFQHLLSAEMLLAYDETVGTIVPRKSVAGQGYMGDDQTRRLIELYRRSGSPQFKYPDATRLNPGLDEPLRKAVARTVSPRAALDEAVQRWNAVMEEQAFTDDID